MTGLFGSSVYTIALPARLAQASRDGTELHESKRWVSARAMLESAARTGCVVPIVFADSRDCSRLIAWSELKRVEVSEAGTRYWIGPLWSVGRRTPQALTLLHQGRKIANGYRRPYALCRTPEFIRRAGRSPRPWAGCDEALEEVREGKRRLAVHVLRERATGKVRQIKQAWLESHGGRLPCGVCGFDFIEVYGEIGAGFAEAHHVVPLADAPADGRPMRAEDLIIVCANCHWMLHRGAGVPERGAAEEETESRGEAPATQMSAVLFHSGHLMVLAKRAFERSRKDDSESMASVLLSAIALECFVNEVQEHVAVERPDDREPIREQLDALLEMNSIQRAPLIERLDAMHVVLRGRRIDRGRQPIQDVAVLIDVRNRLVHRRPERFEWNPEEFLQEQKPHQVVRQLVERKVIDAPAPTAPPVWSQFALVPETACWAYNTVVLMSREITSWFPAGMLRMRLEFGIRDWAEVESRG